MRRFVWLIKRYGLFLPLLALMVVVVGGAAYLSGWLGINRDLVQLYPAQAQVTAQPPPVIERYVGIDPAIIRYLEQQPEYGVMPMDVLGPNVPPVGMYLPQTGNTRFEFSQPRPLPTLLAYPTSPPLPYPTSPPLPTEIFYPTPQPTPTYDISGDLVATVVAFGAQVTPATFPLVCAPAGMPVPGFLTQRFHTFHSGVDLTASLGTPVLATHSAVVTWADWNPFGYGNLVILQSERFITYYAHNTSYNVTVGQYVPKGSIIAFSGSTGKSSGPHVHYETRIDDVPVDPLTFETRGYGTC